MNFFRRNEAVSLAALRIGLVAALLMLVGGCASYPERRSALEVYDDRGTRIANATDTYESSNTYPFTYNDVFDASHKVLFRNGFKIEREDRAKGVLQGSIIKNHVFSGGISPVPFTASLRIKEVSKDPRTRLDLTVDTHWGVFYQSGTVKLEPPSRRFGPSLEQEVQKVLSTFE